MPVFKPFVCHNNIQKVYIFLNATFCLVASKAIYASSLLPFNFRIISLEATLHTQSLLATEFSGEKKSLITSDEEAFRKKLR